MVHTSVGGCVDRMYVCAVATEVRWLWYNFLAGPAVRLKYDTTPPPLGTHIRWCKRAVVVRAHVAGVGDVSFFLLFCAIWVSKLNHGVRFVGGGCGGPPPSQCLITSCADRCRKETW
jgi:hypothetical protein